ncbi:MAG: hypothetical protein PHD88_06355 [Firmicutes bacterium]|nr:hypothetical protein [Bacillota bacterium]MDD4694001.1 hypothetical protein [Bacillota bacterium]
MMLPIWILLILFGFIVAIVAIQGYFSYKEKEMMVKQGAAPEVVQKMIDKDDNLEPRSKFANLRSGVTLIAVGGALTMGLSFIGLGPWLLGGLIPLFLGIGRLILYYILPDDNN